MVTFNEMIKTRLEEIGSKEKAQELKKLFLEFGLELTLLTQEEMIFKLPDNPFELEGEVIISLPKRYTKWRLWNSSRGYNYNYFCYHKAESIFKNFVEDLKVKLNQCS